MPTLGLGAMRRLQLATVLVPLLALLVDPGGGRATFTSPHTYSRYQQ